MHMNGSHQAGNALLTACIMIFFIGSLTTVVFMRSVSAHKATVRDVEYMQAISVAEAGFNRLKFDLKTHLEASPGATLDSGTINDLDGVPSTNGFSVIPYPDATCGAGFYIAEIRHASGNDAWIRSTGRVGNAAATIQGYVRMQGSSMWENAIYAGNGSSDTVMNGNVEICCSVHILGDNLSFFDSGVELDALSAELSGSARIGNNYKNLPTALRNIVPPCPTVEFNGETVESLSAKLRVRRGLVSLSGAASVGEADVPGNAYKETMDGVYVEDGYTGNKGDDAVYSDNGSNNGYDLGDSMSFPSLTQPYGSYGSYVDYFKDNALVVTAAEDLAKLADMSPTASFTLSSADGQNSISLDGNGHVTIQGMVYVDGEVNIGSTSGNTSMTYSGKGSILCTGDINITDDFLTVGAESFPANAMGFMTTQDIVFSTSQLDVAGLFFAEGKIVSTKQTNVAGSFVSNYFDMGSQVPAIYYVPFGAAALPPGLIKGDALYMAEVVAWQRP